MGIAWTATTGGAIVTNLVDIPSVDDGGVALISGIHSAVMSAGWQNMGTYSGGHEYRLTSPQGFRCRCRVYPTTGLTVGVRFLSEDGFRVGQEHSLRRIASGQAGGADVPKLIVWANQCQLFTGAQGAAPSAQCYARAVNGGIPYSGDSETYEIWWASSDTYGSTGLRYSTYRPGRYDACYNVDLRTSSVTDYTDGAFTLAFPLAPTVEDMRYWPDSARWWNGDRLYCDPLVAFGGSSTSTPARVLGQLWDAAIALAKDPIDEIITWSGATWLVYSGPADGNSRFGRLSRLWLLSDIPASAGAAYYAW